MSAALCVRLDDEVRTVIDDIETLAELLTNCAGEGPIHCQPALAASAAGMIWQRAAHANKVLATICDELREKIPSPMGTPTVANRVVRRRKGGAK